MCAIGGILKLDKRKTFDMETQLDTISLLTEMQKRGGQSWGMYIEKHGENVSLNCGEVDTTLKGELFKLPGKFTEFIDDLDGTIYLDGTHTVLLHTRQATHGSSDDNKNNHPFNTKNFILAHNGVISNTEILKSKYNIVTDIECDSYFIVSLIQHFYDSGLCIKDSILNTVNELEGGFACWLYHKDKKDLYLFRNTRNPIEYYIDNDRGLLVFASEDDYIVDTYKDGVLKRSDIVSLEPNKIFKLQSNSLVQLSTFTEREVVYTTAYKYNRACNGVSSINSISEYDKLMARFFIFLSKYDTDTFQHILASTDSSAILCVRSHSLESILDKFGFTPYKRHSDDKDWIRYTMSKECMSHMVDSFLSTVDDSPSDSEAVPLLNPRVDSDLISDLRDLANSSNIIFSYLNNTFMFTITDSTPQYVIKLFKNNGGYTFSTIDGTLTLGNKGVHIKNLKNIISTYLGD